jgi:hypothetical protein
MHFAQVMGEHSAYAAGMQRAYASLMGSQTPRRIRRQARLIQLLKEVGGVTKAAAETGTPRSHFSAMQNGKRGLGDELLAKLEAVYKKPPGWFDQPEAFWPFSDELRAQVGALEAEGITRLEGVMRAHLGLTPVDNTTVANSAAQQQTTTAPPATKDSRAERSIPRLPGERDIGSGSAVGKKSGGLQKPRGSRRA